MPYTKVHAAWEDLPSTATPIDAASLDQIEAGISDAQDDADSANTSVGNHIADASAAHVASAVSFSPIGTVGATNVQDAIAEVSAEIASASGVVDTVVAGTGIDVDSSDPDNPVVAIEAGVYRSSGTDVAVADGGTGASTAAGARTNLGLVIGTDVASQADLDTDEAALAAHIADTGDAHDASAISYAGGTGMAATDVEAAIDELATEKVDKATFPCVLVIAIGDETTAITTGTAKTTFRMPHAMTLTAVRASLTTASSSGLPTFDINETGTTILSTKLTIDANEKTSTTAATAAVISDTALADDAEVTIDVDVAGTGAAGAKIYLIGTRSV